MATAREKASIAKNPYIYLRIDGDDYVWTTNERAGRGMDITRLRDFARENQGAAARIGKAIQAGKTNGREPVL